ncbi:ComEC/Rec2 family competence protein [Streptomyces sp. NPDC086023]|uniref:ComEC/Rec2 family competence protein n=1 Tax=Streptomyces sp. NPDC086023 TaxID=3365746 RepID=UPI0037D503D2
MSGAVVLPDAELRGGAGEPEREGPLDLRLVGPALGAWGAAALALGMPGGWTAAGVVAALVLGGVLLARGAGGGAVRRLGGSAVAGVLLCGAAGGAVAGLRSAEARAGPVPELARGHVRVVAELTVTSDPRRTGTGPPSVLLDAELTRVTGPDGTVTGTGTRVLVVARHEGWTRLLPSTRVRAVVRLAPAREAGDRAVAVARVGTGAAPEVTGGPSRLQRAAGALRSGLREATDGLAPDARALLPGLVVGDTSRVPPDLHEAFRATDLVHLLAVSGSNLTVVLFLLIGPPNRALRAERGGLAPRLGLSLRGTALCGAGLTLAFVVVCRPDPSVLRAAACGAVTLLAIGTGRRRSLVPALAAAVLLLVLWDPWLARSPGFLLSVLATGALLVLAPRWSAALRRRGVPGRLAEVLAAAAAAQAVCAPVVAVLAARVSLVAVPCNLLAELAAGPATVLGFAALAAAPVAMPVAEALAWCAGVPAGWIAGVARTGASLPGAEAGWPGGVGGGLLLALVTPVAVCVAGRARWRWWAGVPVALVLVLAVLRPVPVTRVLTGWPPPDWRYVQCPVGQGDAGVLAAGPGTAVVVDAGPEPGPVDRCLRELSVTRVPLVLLTHFHADHVGGLAGVLRGRAVGVVRTTAYEEPREQAAFVRRTAAAAGVPVARVWAGERAGVGAVRWEVLWPPEGDPPSGSPNDASVVLLVRAGGVSLLLPGDLEPAAQSALLTARPELGPVDVLKVAHHGSAHQDPALLERLRPRLALVPVGENRYGHPAPGTMAALRRSGAAVLRTDEDGAVAVLGTGPRLRAVVSGNRWGVRRRPLRMRDSGSGNSSPSPRPYKGRRVRAMPYRAASFCLPHTRQHDRMPLRQKGVNPYSTGVLHTCSVADGGLRRPEVPVRPSSRRWRCRRPRGCSASGCSTRANSRYGRPLSRSPTR